MQKVFVIAEAGVNHNGSIDMAKKLIDAAAAAGADAVKFQTFKTELSLTKSAPKAGYQITNTGESESQFEMVKKLELSFGDFKDLKGYCEEKNIEFMSTPFDLPSVELLASLGVKKFKLASGEIVNLPLMRAIGRQKLPVIISTGMCTLQEVHDAIACLKQSGATEISVLHCNTEYPSPMKDLNLNAMKTIAESTKCPVGYSDHSLGIEACIAAVALGAVIIEKHFTLDKTLPGPDHVASLNPAELKEMVRCIRNVELALGSSTKQPSPSEYQNIKIARKSIVASKHIKKGEKFSPDNLATKRPGTGISPMDWDKVVGNYAVKNFAPDDQISI